MKLKCSRSLIIALLIFASNLLQAEKVMRPAVASSKKMNAGRTKAASPKNTSLIDDNIRFWAAQMVEHGEFAAEFTNNGALKKRGMELEQKLQKFSKANLSEADRKEFIQLCDEMIAYQNDVMADVKDSKEKPKEQKDLEKALLDHMNKETAYAKKKAEGKQLSEREEVQFWSEEHEGEAHVMATLMNPKAAHLKKESQAVEKQLKNNAHAWADSLAVVEKANAELDAIGKELDADPSKTKVPKKLAAHEKRERERAVQTFELLKLQK